MKLSKFDNLLQLNVLKYTKILQIFQIQKQVVKKYMLVINI
ncbi:hypothetical protein pb186bvf_009251 [Paramecium bursaria]